MTGSTEGNEEASGPGARVDGVGSQREGREAGYVYRRLRRWQIRRGGQRATRQKAWTSDQLERLGLYRLRGKRHDLPVHGPRAAVEGFRQSVAILEPVAKANLQNAVLRQDVAGEWSNVGRALVVEGRYADALAMLDRAVHAFAQSAEQDHSLKEIPFALAVSFIWRGEGLLRAGKTDEALQSFQRGVASFTPLANGSNGAAIALAVSHSKVASAFVTLKAAQRANGTERARMHW